MDDVAEVRGFLRSHLEEQGYVVDEAADGREAVTLCDKEDYDLVLMDIIMPWVDGVEACRQILAAHPKKKPPRVVMLTAHADPGLILESMSAGALGYILKPVVGEVFVESVRNFLQRELPR